MNLNSAERGGYQYKLTGDLHIPCQVAYHGLSSSKYNPDFFFKPSGMSSLYQLPTSSEIPEQAISLSRSFLVPIIQAAFAENLCRRGFLLWFLYVPFPSRFQWSLPVLHVGLHTLYA